MEELYPLFQVVFIIYMINKFLYIVYIIYMNNENDEDNLKGTIKGSIMLRSHKMLEEDKKNLK